MELSTNQVTLKLHVKLGAENHGGWMIVQVVSPGECCPCKKKNMCFQGAGSIMCLPSFIEWLLAVCAQLVPGKLKAKRMIWKRKRLYKYRNTFAVEIDSNHNHIYQNDIAPCMNIVTCVCTLAYMHIYLSSVVPSN